VAQASAKLRPTIPTAIGHCMYVRRIALDVVGGFDPAFSPGYGEEVDFSSRAISFGFRHICADDVFTFHRGGSSFGSSAKTLARRERNDAEIRTRYPSYPLSVVTAHNDRHSPLTTALALARTALVGLNVMVDGMCLGADHMGTQRVVVETIRALAVHPAVARVTVLTPPTLPDYAQRAFASLPDVTIEPTGSFQAWPIPRFDVAYRPYQVTHPEQLCWLRSLADAVVVNQLDFISFYDAAYFPSPDVWMRARDLTRLTLAAVDGVAFLSEFSRSAAASEGLLSEGIPERVVNLGLDHVEQSLRGQTPVCPAGLTPDDAGFVMCLGASYLHKNRPFAIEVWRAMRETGWEGKLVLAGPIPPHGNSLGLEAEMALADPTIRDAVVTLAGISEAEKAWLYEHAGLVLYPTISEGFGMVPFEAALMGVPVLTTRQGSLDEVLPTDIDTIDSFQPESVAQMGLALLTDPVAAKVQIEALVTRSNDYSWERTADIVLELFEAVLRRPRSRAQGIVGESQLMFIGELPAGPSQPHPVRAVVEETVSWVGKRPAVHRVLSPDGSRRQRLAREYLNAIRLRMK
jgi:glycosyltransferase involved in cell wall biosynthesis